MGLLVRFGKHRAFLREAEWRCADAVTESRLNAEMEAWIQETGGPALSDRDPEKFAAEEMARRLGGRVILRVTSERSKAAEVYTARRQMSLMFSTRMLRLR